MFHGEDQLGDQDSPVVNDEPAINTGGSIVDANLRPRLPAALAGPQSSGFLLQGEQLKSQSQLY
jgi:hypothetical protein